NSQLRTGMDNQELIELVAESLITFEHIHPFQRGNSETGQLALIFILLKEKSAPFVIESGDKRRYNRYIHEQNIKGLESLLNEKISMEENKIENYKDKENHFCTLKNSTQLFVNRRGECCFLRLNYLRVDSIKLSVFRLNSCSAFFAPLKPCPA